MDILAAVRLAVGVVPSVLRPVGSPDVQLVRQFGHLRVSWRARVKLGPVEARKMRERSGFTTFGGEEVSQGGSGAKIGPWGQRGAVGVTGLDNVHPCWRGVEACGDGARARCILAGAGRALKTGGVVVVLPDGCGPAQVVGGRLQAALGRSISARPDARCGVSTGGSIQRLRR